MKPMCALLATALASMLFQVIPAARAEVSNSQSKITPGAQNLSLKVGEPFLSARAKILRSGWRPMRMHSNEDYEYSGTERVLADRKFLEVDYCSTDAGSLCVLYYSKGTKCLRLGTVGEQLKYMEVTRWTEECPVGEESAQNAH
jgi:hypothetical protein